MAGKVKKAEVPATISSVPAMVDVFKSLDEEQQESLLRLVQKSNPRKKGLSDEASSGSWRPPSVRIMQPTTRNTAGADGVLPGQMFTSLGQNLETEFNFVILYRYITHTRWTEGEFSGAPNCSSPGELPGEERLNVFGDPCSACPDLPFRNGVKTSCNKNMVYWVLNTDTMEDVYSIQFSKSSYKVGNKLYRLARGQESAWSRMFKLTTTKNSTSRGVFYTYDVTLGEPSEDHQRSIADAFYDVIHAQRVELLERLRDRAANRELAPVEDNAVSDDADDDTDGADLDFNI